MPITTYVYLTQVITVGTPPWSCVRQHLGSHPDQKIVIPEWDRAILARCGFFRNNPLWEQYCDVSKID